MPDETPGAVTSVVPDGSGRFGRGVLARAKRLMPRRVWRRYRTRREWSKRLNEKPDAHLANAVGHTSTFCAWMAKLNGAGAVAAIALMIASYVTLTEDCKVARFVSDTLRDGEYLLVRFLVGGVAGAVGAVAPELIGLRQNWKSSRRPLRRPIAVPVGREMSASPRRLVGDIFFFQLLMGMLSLLSFFFTLMVPLGYAGRQTPEKLIEYRQRHVEVCKTNAPQQPQPPGAVPP